MDLNLFQNLKKDMESNTNIKNFIEELGDFLNNIASDKKTNDINKNEENDVNEIFENNKQTLEETSIEITSDRKEGHLYLVTEDRGNKIYLWDFTDKPEHEFEETILSEELLSVAKEGAMLKYENGEYTLYSK